MPTTKKGKPEPLKVVGSISKLVGTVVGTTVVTGKRVIRSVKPSGESPSKKLGGKTAHAPAKKKKAAVGETGAKTTTRKKVTKRKGTNSSGVSGASKKTIAKSPAKKKKVTARKKKTTHRKTKKATTISGGLGDSKVGLKSEIDSETNVSIGRQEPQL